MKNNRTLIQKSIAISVFSLIAILALAQTEGQKGNSGNPFGLSGSRDCLGGEIYPNRCVLLVFPEKAAISLNKFKPRYHQVL